MTKICCMCNREATCKDTKTNEYLCEDCGRINYYIYIRKNEKPQMEEL